jgi:hypothetical protein
VAEDPTVYTTDVAYEKSTRRLPNPNGSLKKGQFVVGRNGSKPLRIYQIHEIWGDDSIALINYSEFPIEESNVEKYRLEKPIPIPDDGLDGGDRHMSGDTAELIRKGWCKDMPFLTMDEIDEKREHIKGISQLNKFI